MKLGRCFTGVLLAFTMSLNSVPAYAKKAKGYHVRGRYMINSAGKRYHGREKLIRVNKDYYDVRGNGSMRRGWNVLGNHLYYFGRSYKAVRHRIVDGIQLNEKGRAVMNLNAALRYSTIKTLKRITSLDAPKSTQLRAVYRYMGSHRNFRYQMKYPNLRSRTWIKDYAYYMLRAHRGNCYGFASTFSAFAYTIGYRHVSVMTGRVHGNRDHAADGKTRHAWVRIGRYYYDPELNWHGNGAYHRSGYVRANHAYSYDREPGTRMIRKNKVTIDYYKQGHYYYGVNASQKALHGLYVIDSRLFKFDRKGKMSVKNYKKLARMTKEKSPWKPLEKFLGKTSHTKGSDSCYGNGKDVVYRYRHVEFSVFQPADHSRPILESYAKR